uniref:Ribosomal protein S4e N-terminal domain-containing protein n=1 Tax=Salix viminalis TaxID=40686 RepID=A0A6N2LGY4_SALVM
MGPNKNPIDRSNRARGLEKNLKRLNAPKHWLLDKLGTQARECLPLVLILRNRLKYALTYREVIAILMQRHAIVDGKVRTDKTCPSGFMGMCEYSLFTPVTFMIFLCGSSRWDLEFVSSMTWYQMGYRSLCLPSLRYACLESSLCDEMENLQNPNFSSIDTTPTSTSNALTTNTKPKSILAGSATIDKGKQLQVLALRKRNVDEKSHKFEIILLNLMVIVKSTELDDNNKHFMMLMIWIAMIWSLSFAKFSLGRKASLPYLNTYDGRTIHYPDPLITANYTIKLDPIVDFIKFDAGNVVMLTGGRNRGRKRLAESQTAA